MISRVTRYLFDELDRLTKMDVSGADPEALKAEVARARAVEGLAKTVLSSADTVLEVARMRSEGAKVPKGLLDGGGNAS